MTELFRTSASALVLTSALAAQFTHPITYVDADTQTNTTLADGTAYTPTATLATSGTDDEWLLRPFGNGGTVLSSHDVANSDEDAPMLRTTITGLIPTLSYFVYSYHWSNGQSWRGRALVSTAQPAPELPGYNTVHFNGSAFAPMQPLAISAALGFGQSSLALTFDGLGFENSGHFAQPALISEGNRTMYEVWLGVHEANAQGEIHVYIDDLAGPQVPGNRTWFDGVGYEIAPLLQGTACGNPQPTIGFEGAPIMTTPFTCRVDNAPPNALAMAFLGFSNTMWTGGPLPFNLAIIGFPTCSLYVSPDLSFFKVTDANGSADHELTLPVFSPLTLHWQWGVLDGSNNLSGTQTIETVFHR